MQQKMSTVQVDLLAGLDDLVDPAASPSASQAVDQAGGTPAHPGARAESPESPASLASPVDDQVGVMLQQRLVALPANEAVDPASLASRPGAHPGSDLDDEQRATRV